MFIQDGVDNLIAHLVLALVTLPFIHRAGAPLLAAGSVLNHDMLNIVPPHTGWLDAKRIQYFHVALPQITGCFIHPRAYQLTSRPFVIPPNHCKEMDKHELHPQNWILSTNISPVARKMPGNDRFDVKIDCWQGVILQHSHGLYDLIIPCSDSLRGPLIYHLPLKSS